MKNEESTEDIAYVLLFARKIFFYLFHRSFFYDAITFIILHIENQKFSICLSISIYIFLIFLFVLQLTIHYFFLHVLVLLLLLHASFVPFIHTDTFIRFCLHISIVHGSINSDVYLLLHHKIFQIDCDKHELLQFIFFSSSLIILLSYVMPLSFCCRMI